EPPPEGTQRERQQTLDVRLAAARALGNFNHHQATEALVAVLRADKEDVALRERAHLALQASTGQTLPPDAKTWDEFLGRVHDPREVEKPSLLRLVGLGGTAP